MKQAIRGLRREDLQRIWSDVQANQKLLDACAGPHEFVPLVDEGQKLPRYHRCQKCGGRLDVIHAHWYAKGLEHGRRP